MILRPIRVTGAAGIALAADAGGPAQAPTVYLTHGGGQTRHSWGTTARTLVHSGYRVFSLDHRGHGDSAWSADGDYRFALFAADLAAVVRGTANGAPFALAGASLGGLASLLAAPALAPFGLAGLALVDVVPRADPRGTARIGEFMRRHLDGFATLEEAAAAIAEYRHEKPRPRNLRGLAKNLRLREDGRYYWHWDPAVIGPAPVAGSEPRAGFGFEELELAAREVSVPTLLVRGALTDVVSAEGVAELRHLIPQLEVEDVSGAGHIVVGDNNAVFESVIVRFLARVLPPGPPPPARAS